MNDLGTLWIRAMRAGRFEEAWAISDRVLAARDPRTRDDPSLPYHQRWVWDGRPFDGRDVLVRCYHGLGDTIQFARFLPLLAQRARSVTLEVQPALVELMARDFASCQVVPFKPAEPLPPAACDMEITELPHALRVNAVESYPPYLGGSRSGVVPATIGLCHCTGEWDIDRRAPELMLAQLCAGRVAYSLVPAPSALPVHNPQGCGHDVLETAALLGSLAAIVTVDTMIAHLAGAMGLPTWLLLKHDPDWRWEPERATSRWYPSLRMLRQPAPGDWTSVIEELERRLLAEGR